MDELSKNAYLTRAAVFAALDKLTVEEKTAIVKIAKVYEDKWHRLNDHEDLFNEACDRILSLKRPWPRGLSAIQFFAGVMKSIASERKYKFLNQGKGDKEVERAEERAATVSWKEKQLEDTNAAGDIAEYRAKVLALFDDDPVARKVFLLMLDGVKGAALLSLGGLSDTEYESCRRKIRRRIERLK